MKKKDNKLQSGYINQLLGKPVTASQKFHQSTKIKKLFGNGNYDPSNWPEEWKKIYYKAYGRFPEIKLPKPALGKVPLENALKNRKSSREFSHKPLTINHLSNLLYYSAGIILDKNGFPKRFYPSPGGRFPLEVYVLPINSEVKTSFYHYYVKNNSLEKIFAFKKKDLNKITNIPWVKNAGCIVFITAVFSRNTVKYGDRGYRHVLVEAGHLAQNFYLNAAALNLGICAIGGYIDDYVNKTLELDGVEESVVYTLVVGEKL